MPSEELLLVPLDDRPCCLEWVERLARLAGWRARVPDRSLLGGLTTPGDSQAILDWLEQQSTTRALLSLDMLAWGGLVASRQPQHLLSRAQERFQRVCRWALGKECWLNTVLLRTAPTQLSSAEVRQAEMVVELSQWSVRAGEGAQRRVEELRRRIDSDFLARYQATRERNFNLNREAVAQQEAFAQVLVGIDDSKTEGWNILERDRLAELGARIVPGTDELAQLQLVPILAPETEIEVLFDEPATGRRVTRYEDRDLESLVQAQFQATGLRRAAGAPRVLAVFGPSGEVQPESSAQQPELERARRFARCLGPMLENGRRVAVADVACANGAHLSLVEALQEAGLLSHLTAFSAWNTAGNTLGTALSTLAVCPLNPSSQQARIREAFLLERLADDYLYQSLVRGQLRAQFGPGYLLPEEALEPVNSSLQELLLPRVQELASALGLGQVTARARLPWNRLFEVEVQVTTA